MNEQNIEDIISALYDMVQDARALPLGADKCILERDKVLDMLDEIIAQLPVELKQARTIVDSRNELIGQARREAETLIRQAQEQGYLTYDDIHDVLPHDVIDPTDYEEIMERLRGMQFDIIDAIVFHRAGMQKENGDEGQYESYLFHHHFFSRWKSQSLT